MALIRAHAVSKAFRIPSVRRDTVREHVLGGFRRRRFDRLQVLDAVSFEVRAGETLGVMGQNGSGKSTLLKVVCGIYPPDSGTVEVNASLTPVLELGVGWNPELDAIDNVFLIGAVMGLSRADTRASLSDILAFAELEPFARLQLKHYSSGMSSRLAYSVAFHAVREVLILDEIFAVGDAGFRLRCEERYRELRRNGHTVVIVSHDPRIIAGYCDRALLLHAGHIVHESGGGDVARRYLESLGVRGAEAQAALQPG